jgi:hypothetical protein
MGATMEVRCILPSEKELVFPNPKSTTFSCWVLAQATQHYPHNHPPPLLAQEAFSP